MTKRVGKIERSMSVGFVGSTLYGMLPKIIRRFRSEYPAVELSLHEMSTMDQIKALKEGRIDVGFGRIRHEDPSVRRVVLREERMIVALPVGHPLDSAKPVLSLHDLVNDTLIIFPKAPRPSYADRVLAAFHDRALQPRKIYETRELQIALGLVAMGEGVSVAQRVRAEARRHQLQAARRSESRVADHHEHADARRIGGSPRDAGADLPAVRRGADGVSAAAARMNARTVGLA